MNLAFWKKKSKKVSDLPPMDDDDDAEAAEAEWNRLCGICSQNGAALAEVPDDLLTPKLCRSALEGNPEGALKALPKALLMSEKPEVKPWLVKLFGASAEGRRLLRIAGRIAMGADDPLQDDAENARQAAMQAEADGGSETPEAVEKAFMCALRHGLKLNGVPRSLRSEALCFAAVRVDGTNLEYVPAAFRTRLLCRDAVQENGRALEHVPLDLRDADMCREAVASSGDALSAVPVHLRTEALCLEAVQKYGRAIGAVPKKLLTPEICRAAVLQCGEVIYSLPQRLRTDELCLEAAKHDWRALRAVPERLCTASLCLECALQNPKFFEWSWVPEDIRPAVKKAAAKALAQAEDASARTQVSEVLGEETVEAPRP